MKHFNSFLTAALVGSTALFSLGCSSMEAPSVAAGASCGSLDEAGTVAAIYESGAVTDATSLHAVAHKPRLTRSGELLGATLHVKGSEGMSAPYMKRVLACHAAGGEAAHPNDPLVPSQGTIARVDVKESSFGYLVDVRGSDRATNEEIVARAKSMTSSVQLKQVAAAPTGATQL